MSEVRTIKTCQGEEIVGRDVAIKDSFVSVNAPMLLGIGQNGQPTLIPYIFTSGFPEDQNIRLQEGNIVFNDVTDEQIADMYRGMIEPTVEENVDKTPEFIT